MKEIEINKTKKLKSVKKKRSNEQFPGIKIRRHRREFINETVRIFQHVERSFMEIQVGRGNGRRHSGSF